MVERRCTSCNKAVANDHLAASFPCPKCGNAVIIRCGLCRKTAVQYKCPKCGFEGP